jgi:hypothetical protein
MIDNKMTIPVSDSITISSASMAPSHLIFGNVKIDCKTGEVTGLSENITEDARFFWEQVKEYIIGK